MPERPGAERFGAHFQPMSFWTDSGREEINAAVRRFDRASIWAFANAESDLSMLTYLRFDAKHTTASSVSLMMAR